MTSQSRTPPRTRHAICASSSGRGLRRAGPSPRAAHHLVAPVRFGRSDEGCESTRRRCHGRWRMQRPTGSEPLTGESTKSRPAATARPGLPWRRIGIRTPEGVNPTRVPGERHRPLGESSANQLIRSHDDNAKSRWPKSIPLPAGEQAASTSDREHATSSLDGTRLNRRRRGDAVLPTDAPRPPVGVRCCRH